MSLAFRNVTASPDDPVASWPTEAVQTALERGDLEAWRRLVREIRGDPWGRTARQVEEVLSHSHPYGVAGLIDGALLRAREGAAEAERATVAGELRSLVTRSGLTNAQFATRMGTSPSRFSTYVTGGVVPSAALMVRARRIGGS